MESPKEPFYKITVPSLTHANWDQKLVESARVLISSNTLPIVYPVDSEGEPFSAEMLKAVTKTQPAMNAVRQTRRVQDRIVEALPVPTKYEEIRVSLDIVDRLRTFHKAINDKVRSGAIVATILIELGWSVQRVTSILNTSRPTVNRWVYTHQDSVITEEEAEQFSKAMRPDGSSWSALIDFRTLDFRLRRSAMTFKKAVFLPNPEIAQFMRALWRVAYRTRGEKSKYSEYVCAQTLDIVVELLLRRGVTAQNIGHILGIQHMAVIQRHRRAKDVYGEIENTMKGGDVAVFAKDELRIERLEEYTAVRHYESVEDAESERSLLLQVRTSQPTTFRPIPVPNLSVLCDKRDVSVSDLKEFDKLPADKVYKQLDSLPGNYKVVTPLLDRSRVNAEISVAVSSSSTYAETFFSSSTLKTALFNGAVLGYPNVNYPKDVTDLRLTEYLLLQATMQYDRERFGFGYRESRYHWLPVSVLELINIVPEDSSKTVVKDLSEVADSTLEVDTDRILDFFPVVHQNYIFKWIKHSDEEIVVETDGEEKHGQLWKCLHTPNEILEDYPAPEARKTAS